MCRSEVSVTANIPFKLLNEKNMLNYRVEKLVYFTIAFVSKSPKIHSFLVTATDGISQLG